MIKFKLVVVCFWAMGLCFVSCKSQSSNALVEFSSSEASGDTIRIEELRVEFDSLTRSRTYFQGLVPFSGTVLQKEDNGTFYTQVEKGLATYQVTYTSDGRIDRILYLKDGLEHGLFLMFHSTGVKYVEQYYFEGKPVGRWYRWDEAGNLVEIIDHDEKGMPHKRKPGKNEADNVWAPRIIKDEN